MSFRDFVPAHPLPLARLARRFKASRRGNIAVMTALLMMPMMTLMGLALDYGNVLLVKSRLDQAALAAASAAANAARNVIQSANRSDAGYDQKGRDGKALAEGKDIGVKIFAAQLGKIINGRNDAADVSVARVSNTFTANVKYSAQLNTYFMRVWNVNVLNLKGQRSIIVGMLDTASQTSAKGVIIDEQWTAPASSVQAGDRAKPVINDWFSGTPGSISPVVTDPTLLDSKVPTAIRVGSPDDRIAPVLSKKVYLQAGNYEFRYWYKSTVVYPDYEPVYICGTVEGEMHWATAITTRSPASSRTTNGEGAQTSRAGAYLVPILTNPQLATTPPAAVRYGNLPNDFPQPPPLPWTSSNKRLDNSQNRIDICTYSSRWIQRSVSLSVTDPGYFWLSFVAEPPTKTTTTTSMGSSTVVNTVNGFYLGRVQLCEVQCSEPVNTNWLWSPGTTLYTADFTSGTPGTPFSSSSGTFPLAAGYEKTTTWTVRVFGGLRGNPIDTDPQFPLYKYLQSDKAIGPNTPSTIITSNRSSAYLYRGLLLTAGTYRATFTIGAGSSTPGGPNGYCSFFSTATSPASNIAGCSCYVGSPNPNIAHGDQIAATGLTSELDRTTNRTVASYYSRPYTGSVVAGDDGEDTGTADSTNARGSLMGNCYNKSSPKTFTYCFLVPRTQYYGVNFRTAGPQLDTAPASLQNSPYPELTGDPPDLTLGSGGARLYSLKIDVLTQGIKNSNNLDFPDYSTNCNKSPPGNAAPNLDNVMASGTPVWPGVVVDSSVYTRPLIRLTLTTPLP